MALPALAQQAPLKVLSSLVASRFAHSIAEAAAISPIDVKEMHSTEALDLLCHNAGDDVRLVLSISAMTPNIEKACVENGINGLIEARLGFITVVMVQKASDPPMKLSAESLYLALAEKVPEKTRFQTNKAVNWSNVNAGLPDLPIHMLMSPNPGQTRKVFDVEALIGGCRQFEVVQNIFDAAARTEVCTTVRPGVISEIQDITERLEALKNGPPGTVAVLPINAYEENRSWLRIIPFDGFMPTPENVNNEDYDLTAPIYVYADLALLDNKEAPAAARAWLEQALSEGAIGDNGYLKNLGLTVLPAATRQWQRKALAD